MIDVLVVDDAADIRLLVTAVLSRTGARAREAASASEAFAELASARPDVVLLDVQMPDADGWSVLESIRANPRTAEIPVALCSVKGQSDDRARGWRLGCDGYLTKPFDIGQLADEIATVVARTSDERRVVRSRALKELESPEGER